MHDQDRAELRALEAVARTARVTVMGDEDESDPNLRELRRVLGRLDRVRAKRVDVDALLAENERLRAQLAEYDKHIAEFTNRA